MNLKAPEIKIESVICFPVIADVETNSMQSAIWSVLYLLESK